MNTTKLILICSIFLLGCFNEHGGAELISDREYIIVSKEAAALRKEPSVNSEIILRVPYLADVSILRHESGNSIINGLYGHWVLLKYSNTEGYMFSPFVKEKFSIYEYIWSNGEFEKKIRDEFLDECKNLDYIKNRDFEIACFDISGTIKTCNPPLGMFALHRNGELRLETASGTGGYYGRWYFEGNKLTLTSRDGRGNEKIIMNIAENSAGIPYGTLVNAKTETLFAYETDIMPICFFSNQ